MNHSVKPNGQHVRQTEHFKYQHYYKMSGEIFTAFKDSRFDLQLSFLFHATQQDNSYYVSVLPFALISYKLFSSGYSTLFKKNSFYFKIVFFNATVTATEDVKN